MARCKVHEIQGDDESRTAGAVRCHREAVAKTTVEDHKFPICKRHRSGYRLWVEEVWLYAIKPPK